MFVVNPNVIHDRTVPPMERIQWFDVTYNCTHEGVRLVFPSFLLSDNVPNNPTQIRINCFTNIIPLCVKWCLSRLRNAR